MSELIYVIHGAWCGPEHLRPLMHKLSRRFRVKAITLPGHGIGERPGKTSIADYAAYVRGEMAEKGTLVGHSMGALVAQRAAAGNPLAELAILLAPAPPFGNPYHGSIWLRILKYLPSLALGRPFRLTDDDARALLLYPQREEAEPFRPESGIAVRDMVLGQFVFWKRIRIDCPVLVIGGEEDRMIRPSVVRRIAAYYDAEAEMLTGAGHMLGDERYAGIVAGYIARAMHELPPRPLAAE